MLEDGSGNASFPIATVNAGTVAPHTYSFTVTAIEWSDSSCSGTPVSTSSGPVTLDVAASEQTITVPAPPSGPWNASLSVATTASSGLSDANSIDAVDSSANGCGVDASGNVSASGPGTCVVFLDQAGDANYAPAPEQSVTATFNAARKSSTTLLFSTRPTDIYTYGTLPSPSVTASLPAAPLGSLEGDTTVMLAGTNFTLGTTVQFGAVPATSVTVLGATSLSAVSPAGTGTVDVKVTNATGQSSTFVTFDYRTLVFASAAVSGLTSSTPTIGPITVGLGDGNGNVVNAPPGGIVVTLGSTPLGTPTFGTAPSIVGGVVTISAGTSTSNDFYYGDTVSGSPVLSASAPGVATSGNQTETIGP